MKHLLIVATVLVVLPAPLTAQNPASIADEEVIKEKEESFLRISGSYSTEFNFLDSGNALVFSPSDTKGSTYPTKSTLDSSDRKRMLWRNNVNVILSTDYAELWLGIYTTAGDLTWPNAGGLESTLLFPVRFLSDDLKVGFYHNSAHNLVEERYGKSIDVTGAHIAFDILDKDDWLVNIWGTYNFINDKASPFVFTKDAELMNQEDLGRFVWAAGLRVSREKKRYKLALKVAVYGDKSGAASMRSRLNALYKIDEVVSIGPFVEYNRNLRETDRFGVDEWLIGPMLELKF